LGLMISRQFVRLMGSDIEVESRLGAGSTFRFSVDVQPGKSHELRAPAPRVTAYSGARRKVLIVDDVHANRAVLRDMLSELNFQVIEAANASEAMTASELQHPDIILTDVYMPDMDGLELIRHLRGIARLAGIPIIAVSASASQDDAATCLAAGANAFLPKPVVEEALLEQMGALLQLQWIA
jgi:CheY-like chemotaxis protein